MKRTHIQDKHKTRKHVPFWVGISLFVLGLLLLIVSTYCSGFAEWYAQNIYPLLVTSIGRFMGLFPFSVTEMGLYLLLSGLIVSVFWMIVQTIRKGEGKKRFFSWISGVVMITGILFFLYSADCGVNYRRVSFSEKVGLSTPSYSVDRLKEVCSWLTDEVNEYSSLISRDESGVMQLSFTGGELAVDEMNRLAQQYPVLEGHYPIPKKIVISEILSYQGITGVYTPFTIEANYNGDLTPYNIPFTMCHELSHLRGFMQEEEANFIAFLACIGSSQVEFAYSGYLSGWVYCMNALYQADYSAWEEIRKNLSKEVNVDLQANNAFWEFYEGTISETANQINDAYLKANGQADGVQSYNRMVDLIVTYYGISIS